MKLSLLSVLCYRKKIYENLEIPDPQFLLGTPPGACKKVDHKTLTVEEKNILIFFLIFISLFIFAPMGPMLTEHKTNR